MGTLSPTFDLRVQQAGTPVHQNHVFPSSPHKTYPATVNILSAFPANEYHETNPQVLRTQLFARIHALQTRVNEYINLAHARFYRDYDTKAHITSCL